MRLTVKSTWFTGLGLVFLSTLNSCGYHLQSSKSEFLEEQGIRVVYLAPVQNTTIHPGLENIVYNLVQRSIVAHKSVRLVSKPEEADAVLQGSVTGASFTPLSATTADKIKGVTDKERGGTMEVANRYRVVLDCAFSLSKLKPKPGDKQTVWSSGFTREKSFPTSVLGGTQGTTSALINQSEFERAIGELAESMMEDVHEALLSNF